MLACDFQLGKWYALLCLMLRIHIQLQHLFCLWRVYEKKAKDAGWSWGKKGTQSEKCFTQKEKPQCFFFVFNINADNNWHEVRAREFPTFLRILCCWHALSLALWQKHTQLNTKHYCRDVSCSNFIVLCLSSINHPKLLITNYEHAYYVKQQLLFTIIIRRIIAYASYSKWNHTNMRRTKNRSIGTSRNRSS